MTIYLHMNTFVLLDSLYHQHSFVLSFCWLLLLLMMIYTHWGLMQTYVPDLIEQHFWLPGHLWSSPAHEDDEDVNASDLNCGHVPGLSTNISMLGVTIRKYYIFLTWPALQPPSRPQASTLVPKRGGAGHLPPNNRVQFKRYKFLSQFNCFSTWWLLRKGSSV